MENETKTFTLEDLSKRLEVSISSALEKIADEQKKVMQIAQSNPVGQDAELKLLNEHAGYRLHSLLIAMKNGTMREFQQKTSDPQDITTPADGGYTVSSFVASEIVRLIKTTGQARQLFRNIPMPKGFSTLYIPSKLTGYTGYLVGESESITSSKATFSRQTLTPKKFAGLTVITRELLQSASPDIGNYIMEQLAEAVAYNEDTYAFQNGNTGFTGLFYASNVFGNTVTTATTDIASLTYKNILDMIYGLDQKYLAGAKFMMHRSVYGIIRGLTNDYNTPLIQPAQDPINTTLLGFPIVLLEQSPTGYSGVTPQASTPCVILGNPEFALFGTVPGVSVDMSNDAVVDSSSMFQLDQTAIRLITVSAIDGSYTSGMSLLKTAAN